MTLKNKRIEWKARYDAWKKSGQSIAEWCRGQELKRIILLGATISLER